MSRFVPSTRNRHAWTRPLWRRNSSRVAAGSPVRHRSTSRTSSTYAATVTCLDRAPRHARGYIARNPLESLASPALRQLHQRSRALRAQLARRAFASGPDPLVDRLHLIEQQPIVGDDSKLEVAAPTAFRAQPGAGPVRAAQIHQRTVDDHGLQVHARTPPQ